MSKAVAGLAAFLFLSLPPAASPGDSKDKRKNSDIQNIGQRDINKGSWNFYSPEKEIELGQRLAAEAESSVRLLGDPEVTAYIADVAERIVRHSDSRTPLVVRVVDSDEVNAFALPGGFFFINTGLILEAQSEAELASVMAHEVAHVAARHITRQMTKARFWNLVSLPLVFVGGPVGYAIRQGAALAVPLTFLKFSRNAEREADFLGLQYHYATGYDPAAFVDFFERVKRKAKEKNKKSGIAKAFSTHPMTRERILAAQRMIESDLQPREDYVVSTSRFDRIRAHLLSLQGRRDAGKGDLLLRRRDSWDHPHGKTKPLLAN